jgi:hypothetical protein
MNLVIYFIEILIENPLTHLTEWRPLHPTAHSLAKLDTRERAESVLHWLYPSDPPFVRIMQRM